MHRDPEAVAFCVFPCAFRICQLSGVGPFSAYRYILDSLASDPAQGGVIRLLEEVGFEQITCRNFAMGAMSIHVAVKHAVGT